jgi:hypothetical protein
MCPKVTSWSLFPTLLHQKLSYLDWGDSINLDFQGSWSILLLTSHQSGTLVGSSHPLLPRSEPPSTPVVAPLLLLLPSILSMATRMTFKCRSAHTPVLLETLRWRECPEIKSPLSTASMSQNPGFHYGPHYVVCSALQAVHAHILDLPPWWPPPCHLFLLSLLDWFHPIGAL